MGRTLENQYLENVAIQCLERKKIKSIVEIQWLYFVVLRERYPHSYQILVLIWKEHNLSRSEIN